MNAEFDIPHIVKRCLFFTTHTEMENYLVRIMTTQTDSSNFCRNVAKCVWDQALKNGFDYELCNRIEWDPFILDYTMIYVETFHSPVDVYASILRITYNIMKADF